MSPHSISRRRLLQATGATAVVSAGGAALLGGGAAVAAVVPPARADLGVSAYPFDLGQVRLTSGRLLDTADHRWVLVENGDGTHRVRNANSGRLLGILNGSTAWGAQAVQKPDNGAADNRWRLTRTGG